MVEGTRTNERAPRAPRGTEPTRSAVTGVLLCGGRSERMGRDKALEQLGGRALIEHPLEVLREVAGRVVLACGPRLRYEHLDCELVCDSVSDGGPLAGLLAGLEASRTEWIAVLACDMPRTNAATLRALLRDAAARELDACLLEIERGTQPMFAVYRRACAPAVRAALEAGERRMVAFHERVVGGRALRVGSLRLASSERLALNLNTPSELRAEVQARKAALATETAR